MTTAADREGADGPDGGQAVVDVQGWAGCAAHGALRSPRLGRRVLVPLFLVGP